MERLAPAVAARRPVGRARVGATGRVVVWGGYALLLVVAPLVFRSNLERSVLTQIGIAIVACLSYNMLLGQGGMLSFGHAVYTGLGDASWRCTRMLGIADGSFPIPMSLVPLVGGFAGMFFAVAARLRDDQEGRHAVRDDHARHRRAGRARWC